jgi:hypothetical protein
MPLFHDKRSGAVAESNPHYDYRVVTPEAQHVFPSQGVSTHSGHEAWFDDKKKATKFAKQAGGMGYSPNVTKHDRSSKYYESGEQAKSVNFAVGVHKFFKGR